MATSSVPRLRGIARGRTVFFDGWLPVERVATDTHRVGPYWVFARDGSRLEVRREVVGDGVVLVIDGPQGPARSYLFHDTTSLESFQADMERLLLDTGWSFEEFGPDRRSGRDRRTWPRIENDRRRWWTDSRRTTRRQLSRS